MDLFLVALIPLWGLTFNNISLVHLVSSLGFSVLYSVHISHTYLLMDAPSEFSKKEQRIWKARVALSRIGASVFHASLATLLAILIVGISPQSYFFVVFFKLWFGIVVSGMANAFIFIPMILSFIGPTPDYVEKKKERRENFIARRDSIAPD